MKKIAIILMLVLTLIFVIQCGGTATVNYARTAEEPGTYYVTASVTPAGGTHGAYILKCQVQDGKFVCERIVEIKDN